MASIVVLGAGMMGSALCVPLADRGHDVRLIGTHLDAAIVRSVASTGLHPTLGVELPALAGCLPVSELERAAVGMHPNTAGAEEIADHWYEALALLL